jgi:hypothetical protein
MTEGKHLFVSKVQTLPAILPASKHGAELSPEKWGEVVISAHVGRRVSVGLRAKVTTPLPPPPPPAWSWGAIMTSAVQAGFELITEITEIT